MTLQSSAPTPLSRDARERCALSQDAREGCASADKGKQAAYAGEAALPVSNGVDREAARRPDGEMCAGESGLEKVEKPAVKRAVFTLEQDKLILQAGRHAAATAPAAGGCEQEWGKLRR